MLAERVTHWNMGMLECFGSLAHAEPVHDRTRPAIVNCREGNDLGKMEQLEADPQCIFGSLCSVALAPMYKRDPPANSTQGENGNSGAGVCRPTKPINSLPSLTSTAQKPHPRSEISDWMCSAIASLADRSRGLGKNSMTRGSAFSCAKGSRSAA